MRSNCLLTLFFCRFRLKIGTSFSSGRVIDVSTLLWNIEGFICVLTLRTVISGSRSDTWLVKIKWSSSGRLEQTTYCTSLIKTLQILLYNYIRVISILLLIDNLSLNSIISFVSLSNLLILCKVILSMLVTCIYIFLQILIDIRQCSWSMGIQM